jgi:DeoR/GlpR family transcriptional regulator of sugar metabolism
MCGSANDPQTFSTLSPIKAAKSSPRCSILLTSVRRSAKVTAVGDVAWTDAPLPGRRILARRRRELIAEHVRRHGSARVSDLTASLGVSDMTIRRDLDALTRDGVVTKVHGGATLPESAATSVEPGFTVKSSKQLAEKRAIAAAAAALVEPGMAIGLTAGTTTWQLAEALGGVADLIVVTNSIRICETLLGFERPDLTVMLTGGIRTPSDALVGPLAVAALASLHLDQVLMGVHGMSERAGFTTPNLLEAETNKAFAAASERLVVVADHTKWDTVGLASIVSLDAADAVVTDDGLAPSAVEALRSRVDDVVLAPVV